MRLELHDTEPESPAGAVMMDVVFDFQAEEIVRDSATRPAPGQWIVRWVLVDADGERAVWERAAYCAPVVLVRAAPRFTGRRS